MTRGHPRVAAGARDTSRKSLWQPPAGFNLASFDTTAFWSPPMSPRTPARARAPRSDPDKPIVDVAELCARYGVTPRAVYSWLQRSKPGGIYANRPVPAPYNAEEVSRGVKPYWLPRQLAQWDEWRANMVGSGVGGGRPRKNAGGAQ